MVRTVLEQVPLIVWLSPENDNKGSYSTKDPPLEAMNDYHNTATEHTIKFQVNRNLPSRTRVGIYAAFGPYNKLHAVDISSSPKITTNIQSYY